MPALLLRCWPCRLVECGQLSQGLAAGEAGWWRWREPAAAGRRLLPKRLAIYTTERCMPAPGQHNVQQSAASTLVLLRRSCGAYYEFEMNRLSVVKCGKECRETCLSLMPVLLPTPPPLRRTFAGSCGDRLYGLCNLCCFGCCSLWTDQGFDPVLPGQSSSLTSSPQHTLSRWTVCGRYIHASCQIQFLPSSLIQGSMLWLQSTRLSAPNHNAAGQSRNSCQHSLWSVHATLTAYQDATISCSKVCSHA